MKEHYSGQLAVEASEPIKVIGGSCMENIQFIHGKGEQVFELQVFGAKLLFVAKDLTISINGLLWDFHYESCKDRLIVYKRPPY